MEKLNEFSQHIDLNGFTTHINLAVIASTRRVRGNPTVLVLKDFGIAQPALSPELVEGSKGSRCSLAMTPDFRSNDNGWAFAMTTKIF